MSPTLPIAAGLSAIVALAGWWAGALTRGGVVAAAATGTAIVWGAGWPGALALALFFVGSSAVSRTPGAPILPGDAKGDRRDAAQVLANGGAAAAVALLFRAQPELAAWTVTASLAAAAADTWATAIGARSRKPPRLLAFGREVPPGTNGGMTVAGTAGAVAGAASVAGITGIVMGSLPLALAGTMTGFAGMVADSLLGATAQGRFHCISCNEDTEHQVHRCGAPSTHEGGISWLGNDGVNAAATSLAALAGMAASRWLGA